MKKNLSRKGMMKLIMDKKGIFYSLSVILFLILLIIVFSNKSDIFKKEEKFHIERTQIIVMDHFVRDFDRYYAESILKAAAKPALISLTKGSAFTLGDVVNLMIDGSGGGTSINPLLSTNEGLNQALRTLTFNLDAQSFNYSLTSVEQLEFDQIQLNFEVDYYFKALDTNWSRKGLPVNIILDVYGMSHPRHLHAGIIDSSWVPDSTGCYRNIIFSENIACRGNIRPLPVCGNWETEYPEESCDDGNRIDGDGCSSSCQLEITP